eukprot:CAMPEP_0195099722 /NCGR_PEP_ID=MMETSP0448-20130528/59186_1 /TAXON_ID=66468 /ORGANISM="Heterocapsa triquestra, Strain CCMP 448" /LENGTH=98 /DNA_ID=CAMNT_0040134679 /DNA_START=1 /DNA_END=294 /DNA_ORIENTATION=-
MYLKFSPPSPRMRPRCSVATGSTWTWTKRGLSALAALAPLLLPCPWPLPETPALPCAWTVLWRTEQFGHVKAQWCGTRGPGQLGHACCMPLPGQFRHK